MTKKCDIKGCKETAVTFTQTLAFCQKHHEEIYKGVGCTYCSKE